MVHLLCRICRTRFLDGINDMVSKGPCNHIFHTQCLVKLSQATRSKCPHPSCDFEFSETDNYQRVFLAFETDESDAEVLAQVNKAVIHEKLSRSLSQTRLGGVNKRVQSLTAEQKQNRRLIRMSHTRSTATADLLKQTKKDVAHVQAEKDRWEKILKDLVKELEQAKQQAQAEACV